MNPGAVMSDMLAACIEHLSHPCALTRCEAIENIGLLHDAARKALKPEALTGLHNKLVRCLYDSSSFVRCAAAQALGDIGAVEAVIELERILQVETDDVKAYAAASLGLLDSTGSLPLLRRLSAGRLAPPLLAEVSGARYRLGDENAIDTTIVVLAGMTSSDAPAVLNALTDLIQHRPPAMLSQHAVILGAALAAVSERLPEVQRHVDQLLASLARLPARK